MEKDKLYDFNNTEKDYMKEKTLNEFFEEMVKEIPDNVAITVHDSQLTYVEYNIWANKLARTLIKKGICEGDVVAICFEKSIQMMIAIMAIIKIGATYLPVDKKIPNERLEYILKDSKAKFFIKQKKEFLYDVDININVLIYDEMDFDSNGTNINHKFSSSNIAYIIYTSGSTGIPKGVMVRHYSVVNHILWRIEHCSLSNQDVFIQKTPYTFDISVWEIFLWFFVGAKLHLCACGKDSNVENLLNEIEENKVTVCQFIPSMLLEILKYSKHRQCVDKLKSLRIIFSGGEVLHSSTVSLFYELLTSCYGTQLYNVYGPTETTIDSTCFNCNLIMNQDKIPSSIPIGTPIWNTKIYIVDEKNNLCDDGTEGEIFISGDGVAAGYCSESSLENSVFVPNPWDKGKIMYKTGDIGCWNNGLIEFCGRKDQQVKVRGMRVELGEIESAINKIDGIIQSVVIYGMNDSDRKLYAFYVSNVEVTGEEIVSHISKWLPSYMIPNTFIRLDKLLYTSSGKIDRQKMISEYGIGNTVVDINSYTSKQMSLTKKEKEILDILCKELKVESSTCISEDTTFSDLGIESVSFIRLIVALEENFNFEFEDDMLMADVYPTVYSLVSYIISRTV